MLENLIHEEPRHYSMMNRLKLLFSPEVFVIWLGSTGLLNTTPPRGVATLQGGSTGRTLSYEVKWK